MSPPVWDPTVEVEKRKQSVGLFVKSPSPRLNRRMPALAVDLQTFYLRNAQSVKFPPMSSRITGETGKVRRQKFTVEGLSLVTLMKAKSRKLRWYVLVLASCSIQISVVVQLYSNAWDLDTQVYPGIRDSW